MDDAADDFMSYIVAIFGNGALAKAIVITVILIITGIVCHAIVRIVRRLLSHENSPLPQSTVFINVVRVVVWAIGVSTILGTVFKVDVNGLVTALGIGGIAISLGLQDTISNFIGGLQMSLMGTVEPGDHVEISGRKGVVHDVTWRNVTIDTANGQRVVVPNSVINGSALVKLPPEEKVIIPVMLYKNFDNIEDASNRICAEVKKEVSKFATITQDPVLVFTEVADFSYTGNVVLWVDLSEKGYPVTVDVADAVVRVVAKLSPSC